jgi:hypothetical protein
MKSSILDRRAASHRFARARSTAAYHVQYYRIDASRPIVVATRLRLIVLEHTSLDDFTPSGAPSSSTQSA